MFKFGRKYVKTQDDLKLSSKYLIGHDLVNDSTGTYTVFSYYTKTTDPKVYQIIIDNYL